MAQMNAASERGSAYGAQAQYYANRADQDQAYALQTRQNANTRMRQTVGNFVERMNSLIRRHQQKSQQPQKKKTPWGSMGGGLLGAGVGALLAAPTGGVSVAAGAALGMGFGGAAGAVGDAAMGAGDPVAAPAHRLDPELDGGGAAPSRAARHAGPRP